jgi:CRP-like cAMP-binding protein
MNHALTSPDAPTPPDATQAQRILSHLPLFQSATPVQLATLASHITQHRLDKGALLFQRGDAATGFFIVVYGQIKLFMLSPQGQEKVVEIIHPSQSLGEAVMFLGKPYPVSAEALQDALLLSLERSAVDALLDTDPGFARRMLAGLSLKLHSLLKDVDTYSQRSSTQRVIGYFLQQCEEAPDAEPVALDLPVAKQVIASRLNLTPESLSRSLAELSRAGLIEVQGRTIVIASLQRLREHTP